MARFILMALGSLGDIMPNLGIGKALLSRGHEVIMVSNEVYENEASHLGLSFCRLGNRADLYRLANSPKLWTRHLCYAALHKDLILPSIQPGYRIVESLYIPGDTVLSCPGHLLIGRIAHEKLGIPLVTPYLQPLRFSDLLNSSAGMEKFLFRMLGSRGRKLLNNLRRPLRDRVDFGDVNSFLHQLGLDRIKDWRSWQPSPQKVLGLWPSWFCSLQEDLPDNFVQTGFIMYDKLSEQSLHFEAQETEIAEFVKTERPLVFTFGTGMNHAQRFFSLASQACSLLNRAGLLLTPFRDQIPGSLPENVRHASYLPFSTHLPLTSALIHHGGIGTIAHGIAAGVPQIIVPVAFDHFDNAYHVESLNLGCSLPFGKLSAKSPCRRDCKYG